MFLAGFLFIEKFWYCVLTSSRIAGHHQLADRLIECQYELSDKLSVFLCGRKPNHSIGEHFLIPKTDRATNNSDAHNKLQEVCSVANITCIQYIYSLFFVL